MKTIHLTPTGRHNEWPAGRRICVCESQIIIETYSTRIAAEHAAQYARDFYNRHGVAVSRPIFTFMPGIGFFNERMHDGT